MQLPDALHLESWAAAIEMLGALIIVGYVAAALFTLLRTRDLEQARLLVADGAITGLSFKLAGTLLKTISLTTWSQVGLFIAIFILRTALKRVFTWEAARIRARRS